MENKKITAIKTKQIFIGLAIFLIVSVVGLTLYWELKYGDMEREVEAMENAKVAAIAYVLESLEYPETAKFPHQETAWDISQSENAYYFTSYVEAEGRLNISIKAPFTVIVSKSDHELLYYKFDDKVIVEKPI